MKLFEYTYDEAYWKLTVENLVSYLHQPRKQLLTIIAGGEKFYIKGEKAQDYFDRLEKQTKDIIKFAYTYQETICRHVASKISYSVFVPKQKKLEFKVGSKYVIRGADAQEFYERLLKAIEKVE